MSRHSISKMLNNYDLINITNADIILEHPGSNKKRIRPESIKSVDIEEHRILGKIIIQTYSARYRIITRKQKSSKIYKDIQNKLN